MVEPANFRDRQIVQNEIANHPGKEPSEWYDREEKKVNYKIMEGPERPHRGARTARGKEALPADTRYFCHNRDDIKGVIRNRSRGYGLGLYYVSIMICNRRLTCTESSRMRFNVEGDHRRKLNRRL